MKLADDLQAHFTSIFGTQLRPSLADSKTAEGTGQTPPALPQVLPGNVPPWNVVRPAAFARSTKEPSSTVRSRPELAAALDAVAKASEFFRDAEQQAERRAQRAIDVALRSMTQLETLEAKLNAADAVVEQIGRRSEDEARRLHAEIEARDAHIGELESRVAALTTQLDRQDGALRDSTHRAETAEAQAAAALDDLTFLSARVSEALAAMVPSS